MCDEGSLFCFNHDLHDDGIYVEINESNWFKPNRSSQMELLMLFQYYPSLEFF